MAGPGDPARAKERTDRDSQGDLIVIGNKITGMQVANYHHALICALSGAFE
jgi:hypothetical protein